MYGWAGTLLRVDLTEGELIRVPLDHALRMNYLGGRGINSRILFAEVGPATDPLSPQNRLLFGTGPLVGTLAPSPGRYTVSAKSPLTGILGDANSGGSFAPELKGAGYDHLIFQERAERPVYLWICDDHAEIRSAAHLWGKTTWETERLIQEELGDPGIQVASIGPAGDNRVKLACVINNLGRAAGRCGMGAVMGSKNLKAVAVRGTRGVQVAHPQHLLQLAGELRRRIRNNPGYLEMSVYGTPDFAVLLNELGILPVRNLQQVGGYPEIERISHEVLARKFFVKSKACFGCPIHCSHHCEVREGPYAGEPISTGPHQGEAIDPRAWGKRLDRYYALRGWDPQTGIPTAERLLRLGLKEVAAELGEPLALEPLG